MMKRFPLFLATLLIALFATSGAYADGGGDIFGKLADKAWTVGAGLREAGFIIAGLGLIVFSFMAIFNKISWKTLAYIMMSTFILTATVAVINYVSDGKAKIDQPDFSGPGQVKSGGTDNVVRNPVSK
ncbi:MAG: TrbC/VirB2 family protein [Alphaproteobacteria bacterium]|nr:TrbC/VirB2 family protein [Alphaproteobacteria bacterium]